MGLRGGSGGSGLCPAAPVAVRGQEGGWGWLWQSGGVCFVLVEGCPRPPQSPGTPPAAGPPARLCCGARTSGGHQRAEELLHPSWQHPQTGSSRRGAPQATSLCPARGHGEDPETPCSSPPHSPEHPGSGVEIAVGCPQRHIDSRFSPEELAQGCGGGCCGWELVTGGP